MSPPDRSAADRTFRFALSVLLGLFTLWIMRTPDGYGMLDDVDLAIHETGHLVFGWGPPVLAALGGTLLQLIVPALFAAYFGRAGDWHAATVPLWWLGQNGWNVARYVADARAQALPLVGGGEHDWAFLLAEWNRLGADAAIAQGIRTASAFVMLGAAGAGVWLSWRGKPTSFGGRADGR